jgi:hypothetical protein
MRDDSDPVRRGFVCEVCQRFIVTAIEGLYSWPTVGSPQRFCTPACRQAAYRRRRAEAPEATPLLRKGGRNRRLKALEEVVISPES